MDFEYFDSAISESFTCSFTDFIEAISFLFHSVCCNLVGVFSTSHNEDIMNLM